VFREYQNYFSQFNSIPEIYFLWNKIKELNGTLLILSMFLTACYNWKGFQLRYSESSHKNISVIVQSTHYLVTQLLNLSTVKTNIFLQNGERKPLALLLYSSNKLTIKYKTHSYVNILMHRLTLILD
jgi:hypothetical protein